MLFHVTMIHTADNCPAFHTEHMPALVKAIENIDATARKSIVRVESFLWGAPAHVGYAVLEADSLGAIGRLLSSVPIVQDFEITPVEPISDLVDFAKALLASQSKK